MLRFIGQFISAESVERGKTSAAYARPVACAVFAQTFSARRTAPGRPRIDRLSAAAADRKILSGHNFLLTQRVCPGKGGSMPCGGKLQKPHKNASERDWPRRGINSRPAGKIAPPRERTRRSGHSAGARQRSGLFRENEGGRRRKKEAEGSKRGGFPVHSRKMARRKIRLGRRRRGRTQRKREKHKTDGIKAGSAAGRKRAICRRQQERKPGKESGSRPKAPKSGKKWAEREGKRSFGTPKTENKEENAPKRCTFFCFCSIITK